LSTNPRKLVRVVLNILFSLPPLVMAGRSVTEVKAINASTQPTNPSSDPKRIRLGIFFD
jgi:hypothetical protein